jgi:hypothetical protein
MRDREIRKLKEKYPRFTWSSPVGYDFEEVETTIREYKQAISDAGELIYQKEEAIRALNDKITRLESTIVQLNIQLAAVKVPEFDDDASIEILDEFMREVGAKDQPQRPQQQARPQQQQRQRQQYSNPTGNNNRQQQWQGNQTMPGVAPNGNQGHRRFNNPDDLGIIV